MHSRIHLFYSGYVQGVGFRFTAERIALSLGLKGRVKNLRDGRVEVVAEGERDLLEDFMQQIQKSFLGRYIRDVEVAWEEPRGEFESFEIGF
ncbi:MAG: acylphosphatase [Candidatus Omnitrophica bacterium]|nr:acylphosphatase [Candidatus Omnitrophota bacterium]